MKRILFQVIACLLLTGTTAIHAQDVLKGQKPPTIMKFLVQSSPEFSVMVKSINAARLTETFEGSGPVTLFAPRNKAFDVLPAGTVDNWLKPEAMDSLQKILTYHVIAGNWPVKDLEQKIKEAGGEFFIPTIGEGGKLSFMVENGSVVVKDQRGFKTVLGIPAIAPNGMVYTIDKLLLP